MGTEDEWKMLMVYIASFYMNKGNYKGFGDNKFIPELPKEKFYNWIQSTKYYKNHTEVAQML